MRRIYSLLILMIVLFSSTAQDFVHPAIRQLMRDLENKQIDTGSQFAEYKGSPYLFESGAASLEMTNGQKVDGLTIRYNVYDDQMEIKKGEHYYAIPKEKTFMTFTLNGHPFVLKPYQYGTKKSSGYFEPLVDDKKCGLFLKHDIILVESVESQGYKEAQPAKFVNNPPKVFVSFDNGMLAYINSKKDFLNLLPNHKEEMEKFIKKNKIKFRKPESIKELVQFYNTL
ncbi:hypothetical protein [Carboxylicivirga marina]|uniref:GLPGLI family protein n=1 Tax=Carboxylicivirga marina TaxID=2800988 RepID=A0ABS1HEE7_9BACT|nr:hypothetical protein [Carboxylicivirga marina]MBK3515996.1 hypothetical protein [Carboxylicivirga marina]